MKKNKRYLVPVIKKNYFGATEVSYVPGEFTGYVRRTNKYYFSLYNGAVIKLNLKELELVKE